MSRLKIKLPVAFSCAALVLVLLAGLAPSQANATPTIYTLTDGDASSQINPSSQAGMFSWYVDGVNYLNQQWFWYRVGSGPQHSIDTLTLTGATLVDPSTLKLNYTGAGFTMAVNFFLQGGQPGSGTADMGEQIKITNTSTSSFNFHLFEYVDFNLSQGQDKAKLIYPNTIDQYYQSNKVSETSVSPNPSYWEIANYANTLNHLNGTPNYILNDTPGLGDEAGPGNLTWAFEYDKVIGRNQSLIISKDKVITVIPIPASAILLGTGLLGLVGAGLKRRR